MNNPFFTIVLTSAIAQRQLRLKIIGTGEHEVRLVKSKLRRRVKASANFRPKTLEEPSAIHSSTSLLALFCHNYQALRYNFRSLLEGHASTQAAPTEATRHSPASSHAHHSDL